MDAVVFHPRPNATFFIYAHSPGEELFFRFFIFPEIMTSTVFSPKDFMMDFQMKKVVYDRTTEGTDGHGEDTPSVNFEMTPRIMGFLKGLLLGITQ